MYKKEDQGGILIQHWILIFPSFIVDVDVWSTVLHYAQDSL